MKKILTLLPLFVVFGLFAFFINDGLWERNYKKVWITLGVWFVLVLVLAGM